MKIQVWHIFALIAVCILIAIVSSPSLKINSVKSGNRIVLSNGVIINLIGVADSDKGVEFLNEYIGKEIKSIDPVDELALDIREVSAGNTIYGYVYVGNICLNEIMLRDGHAPLLADQYLTGDKLNYYTKIAKIKQEEVVVVPDPEAAKEKYAEDDIIDIPNFQPNPDRIKQHFTDDSQGNIDILEYACDYNLPYTRSFAIQLAGKSSGNFKIEQVCEIYNYCLTNWKYVNDPNGHEYVALASESIAATLTGDCDDFAVVIASCCLAVGGNARIILAYGPHGGHAYPQVDINTFENKDKSRILEVIKSRFPYKINDLNIKYDGEHAWLNLDWQAPYPGCSDFPATERNYYACIDGVWKYQGTDNYQ